VADPGISALAPTARRAIVRDSLGVGIATGLYGTSFGAISVAAGLSVVQTCVLSLVMFTGASQFAFVGFAASGGAPLSGALTALMLGTPS
jgi:predicted branched-subunit amino acid permease